jgi:hypothetical protein
MMQLIIMQHHGIWKQALHVDHHTKHKIVQKTDV